MKCINRKIHTMLWMAIAVMLLLMANKSVGQEMIDDVEELPKVLQKMYKERITVIKNDTITYRHRWFMPDQYKLQFAGSIGFMSVGFGYEIGQIYQPALFIGYVGPHWGGSLNRIVTVSMKNTFRFTRQPVCKYFMPYGGLSINWGNTNNTFKTLPDYYPDEYYFQNMVHFAPFVGGELKFSLKGKYFNAVGVYSEISAFDAYLLEAIRTKYVKPHMALSLAVGITFYLK